MAPHSSTLAWKIPWTEEPGRLQSMESLGVGHDWATSLSLFTFLHWRRKWQPTPVFLPGESQGRGSLVGCRLRGCRVGHDWSNLAAAGLFYKDLVSREGREFWQVWCGCTLPEPTGALAVPGCTSLHVAYWRHLESQCMCGERRLCMWPRSWSLEHSISYQSALFLCLSPKPFSTM